MNLSSANHFPSLRLSFLFRIASALVPATLLVLGPLATQEQPRCPWPPGGERDQSRNTDNVATWWWILGEREQLDVEVVEAQQAQGSLEDPCGRPPRSPAEAGWSPRGLFWELARSMKTQLVPLKEP